MSDLRTNANRLRRNMTPQERKLWNLIRKNQLGCKFLRQYIIGNYIVDFVCREKKLIIEIDGGQHNSPQDTKYDKKRTEYLNSLGYNVIRFWNNDIDKNIEGVYEALSKKVSTHPNPPS